MSVFGQSARSISKGLFTYTDQSKLEIRSGVILDRGRGSMIQWYGLLVPMKRSEYLLDSISQVEMTCESGDSDSAATWPVKLSGDGQVNPISIVRPTSFIEALKEQVKD